MSLENEPYAVAKISAQAVEVEVEMQELKHRLVLHPLHHKVYIFCSNIFRREIQDTYQNRETT